MDQTLTAMGGRLLRSWIRYPLLDLGEINARLDAVVGYTLEHMPPDTVLVVMSDHGFVSWRRAFNLNTWLKESGYLALKDPSRQGESEFFANVDWSRTQAYAVP